MVLKIKKGPKEGEKWLEENSPQGMNPREYLIHR